jgi:excisionase family DNA binding protein
MTNTRRGTPVDDRKIPALLSVVEAAVILDVHRNNVLHMINSGKLPARKVGSTWVIREAVLSAMEVSDATEAESAGEAGRPACTLCPDGWGDRRTSTAALSVHQRVHHGDR